LSQELENAVETSLIGSTKDIQLKVQFEDNPLWESFNTIGTEMIANRSGR
jgi:hypothetical protein